MISQNELYDKLQYAKLKYTEYTLRIAEKYSTGNINKKIPLKLNVISQWLKYLDEHISLAAVSPSVDPTSIILNNFELNLPGRRRTQNVDIPEVEVLYITDNLNRTVPISKFNINPSLYYNENVTSEQIAQQIYDGGTWGGGSYGSQTYGSVTITARTLLGYYDNNSRIKLYYNNMAHSPYPDVVTVAFEGVGSAFNNKKIKSSSGYIKFDSTTTVKGSNAVSRGTALPYDKITSYNTVLDTIALDLKFSYKEILNSTTSSYSRNVSSLDVQVATTKMLTEAGVVITDENNNSLTFE